MESGLCHNYGYADFVGMYFGASVNVIVDYQTDAPGCIPAI